MQPSRRRMHWTAACEARSPAAGAMHSMHNASGTCPLKSAPSRRWSGRLDPQTWVSPQTASRSVQPFLHSLPCSQHTDTHRPRFWCTACSRRCGL